MDKTPKNETTISTGNGAPQQVEELPQLYARDAATEALLRRHLVSIHDEIARGTLVDPELVHHLEGGLASFESTSRRD